LGNAEEFKQEYDEKKKAEKIQLQK